MADCLYRQRVIWVLWAVLLPAAGWSQEAASAETVMGELRSGQADDALRHAAIALQRHPNDVRLWTLKGLAARQLKESGVALSAFEHALSLDPRYVPALEGACELLYAQGAPQARLMLDRLLAERPDEPNAHAMSAMLAYRAGEFGSAAEHFRRAGDAIASQQTATEAYADSLARLHRDGEALSLLRTLVERWPAADHARYNLAVLQSRAGERDAALRTLDPLLAREDEAALSLAAALHEEAGETPAAVDLLRRAMTAKPEDPQNYLDFGALSFDHGSPRTGIAMLNAGLTRLPRDARLHVARGILYMQIAETEAAERDFVEANRLDPSQSFGFEAQGLSEIERHDLPEALRKVKRSLASTPDNAYLNYLAAEILKERGAAPHSSEAGDALRHAQRAVELDPSLTAARNLVGSLEFAEGDLPAALTASRAVLAGNPADQESLFRIILVLRRTGDPQHEVAALLGRLQAVRAAAGTEQQKVDRYRLQLTEAPVP